MLTKPTNLSADYGHTPIPARAGIGLKPAHFGDIFENTPEVDWFEIHPENYLMSGGPMHHYLGRIRDSYPLSFHSIGMSLGSVSGIDEDHVRKIKHLAERYQPAMISDHLSWSRWHQTVLNDLLPMPYTYEAFTLMSDNVDKVQTILGRSIAIENPSSYFDLAGAEMDECDFLVQLARRSGASILLDVNNVYVSACNHGWCAENYLSRIPAELVKEVHLAGHKVEPTEFGEVRIDDHGSQVCSAVWSLFEQTMQRIGPRPTLIEWDTDVPAFDVLLKQARIANQYIETVSDHARRRHIHIEVSK